MGEKKVEKKVGNMARGGMQAKISKLFQSLKYIRLLKFFSIINLFFI